MDNVFDRHWDAVVIGAGLGGGLCGRALAEAGLSVLFLERGPDVARTAQTSMDSDQNDPEPREQAGCWPVPVDSTVNGVFTTSWGAQGVGIGGTSVFYAAAMEQPERHDLDSLPDMTHPTGGWPLGYDAFAPWFDRAREVMGVNGTPDPLGQPAMSLATPRPLAPRDAALGAALEAAGLHPYRAHLGIRQLDGCMECIGRKCPKPCKMDGRSAGVEPALATGRAAVLPGATVLGFSGEGQTIGSVRIRHDGRERRLQARTYVLAAGGLGSPRLLMASASEAWPQGCANSSGLVGRGLMFHINERIAVWPPRGAPVSSPGPAKTFSMRDLYRDGPDRMGLFQSLGLPASYGNILYVLRQRYQTSPLRRLPLGQQFLRIPAYAAAQFLGEARVFAAILEDLADDENRVRFDPQRPDAIIYDYTMSDELLARRRRFRRLLKKRLGGLRSLYLNHAPELNIAHPCGTLRFSKDSSKGVLDPNCKAHDLNNLYVTDSSFMPSSTGVNPGLTIVANALRVADAITARHRMSG
ncbi:GMC oxidoreductase [Paracoccus sp. (in: a-proteobacteria)]|uniref:GMC oxidoreductase n=1 Tax=Paracoccus sp. TaxID=267 RepID=UPI00396C3131